MTFQIIRLTNHAIYDQLLIEEQLLRHESGNYILINSGSPPAIVLGISGKVPELVHLTLMSRVTPI